MTYAGYPQIPRLGFPTSLTPPNRRQYVWLVCLVLLAALCSAAQTPSPAQQSSAVSGGDAALQELQSQVRELKELVIDLQKQTQDSHAEITRLRQELEVRGAAAQPTDSGQTSSYIASGDVQQQLAHIEEDQQLLTEKVNDQYQTKLESASKYRVRFSGIVLFNLFGNSGQVDNQDLPTWATYKHRISSSGSVGATMRQSILGFEAFGPDVFGAHASAAVNFDFGGGFPATYNGVDSALVRLRTADVRLDWKDTSVVLGQDQLFLSPLAPTSFASVVVPPLSYSGNLWAWTPQLRIEHRFALSDNSTISVQGALMDPLTGEPPDQDYYTWYRTADAGEQSRQPAYALHVGYSRPMLGQTLMVGAGGYYSRENWGYSRMVNGWAGIMDANLPLSHKFSLSAEIYRGAAIGGLGAALGRSVLFDGVLEDPNTSVVALNSVGGWGQLKFRATPKLEFNAAFGDDNPFASEIRYFGDASESYAPMYITRNRSAFGNVIYRPKSDLLLALEYRRLRSFTVYDNSYQANQINMAMGVLF
jgi:Skp family chaperone for outer membrane proteins